MILRASQVAPLYLLLWASFPQKKCSSCHSKKKKKKKRVQNALLVCNLINNRMISVPFKGYKKAGQRLTEYCQENALVMANTLFQQHKRRLYIQTSPPVGQYQNQIDYLCSQRWRSYIQSAKTRLGADCGSNHELLIIKFRQTEKVGKTTRLFRYEVNQIPYDYTLEVTSRFKGLDLIEFLKNYGGRFLTLYRKW